MTLEQALSQEMHEKLPGTSSHRKMMPIHRPKLKPQKTKAIKAAVSLIMYSPRNNNPQIILIKRTDYKGYHSGQISFPGGKVDRSDKSLLQTAIRETREEIGVELQEHECLGTLTPFDIEVSGFIVTPFVFYLSRKTQFAIDSNEVKYMIWFNPLLLLHDNIIKTTQIRTKQYKIQAPYFDIEGEVVWGATAMVLSEFGEILNRTIRKNPGIIPGY